MAAVTEGEIRDKPDGDLAAGRIRLTIEASAPGGLEQAVRLPDKRAYLAAAHDDGLWPELHVRRDDNVIYSDAVRSGRLPADVEPASPEAPGPSGGGLVHTPQAGVGQLHVLVRAFSCAARLEVKTSAERITTSKMGFCAEDHDVFFKYRFFPTNVQRWFVKNSISYAALAVDKTSSLTSLSIKKLFKFSRIICYT